MDEKTGTLDLRPKEYIPVRKRLFWKLLKRFRYAVTFVFAIAVAFVVATLHQTSQAQVAGFYATSCLGDWQNTRNVSGPPDATQYFDASNSAIWTGTGTGIFCGGFDGELPEQSQPSRVTLMFSWHIGQQKSMGVEAVSVDTEANVNEEKSTEEIVAETSTTTQDKKTIMKDTETPNEKASTTEEIKETVEEEQEISVQGELPEDEVEPEAEQPEESTRRDFYMAFANVAFAQEVSTTTKSEVHILKNKEAVETKGSVDVIEKAEADGTVTDSEVLLEILYTFDGENWEPLANITKANWQNSLFPLPTTSWHSLRDIQIQVRNTTTDIDAPVIYLDSLWIEAEYEGAPISTFLSLGDERVQQLAGRILDLGTVGSMRHFGVDDTIDFEITLPHLTDVDIDNALGDDSTTSVPITFSTEQGTSTENVLAVPPRDEVMQSNSETNTDELQQGLEEYGTTTDNIMPLVPIEDTSGGEPEEKARQYLEEYGTTTLNVLPLTPLESESTDLEDASSTEEAQ